MREKVIKNSCTNIISLKDNETLTNNLRTLFKKSKRVFFFMEN